MATGSITIPKLNKNVNIIFSADVVSGFDKMFAYKNGHVVTLNGYIKINNIENNVDKQLGTVADDLKPQNDVRTICGVATNAYEAPSTVGFFTVYDNGKIIFRATTSGTKSIWVSCSWIV